MSRKALRKRGCRGNLDAVYEFVGDAALEKHSLMEKFVSLML